jgi:hypothetical protein
VIYLKAEITVRANDLANLLDLFRKRFFPILERDGGWRLVGCFAQRTGRINTLVDIWELDNYAHFETGYTAFTAHPDYPEIRQALNDWVETETILFMEHLFGSITDGVRR